MGGKKKQRHGDASTPLWPLGQGRGDSRTVLVVEAAYLQAQTPHSRQNNNPILCWRLICEICRHVAAWSPPLSLSLSCAHTHSTLRYRLPPDLRAHTPVLSLAPSFTLPFSRIHIQMHSGSFSHHFLTLQFFWSGVLDNTRPFRYSERSLWTKPVRGPRDLQKTR